jgi:hypothetical protein
MRTHFFTRLVLLFLFLPICSTLFGQIGLTDDRFLGKIGSLTDPSDTLKLRQPPTKISMYGYYRMFLYGRTADFVDPTFEKAYGVGDGYREPMLSLNVVARPNGRSSFGTELFIFTPYDGQGFQENVFGLNLGLNFYGNFRTEVGNFGVRAGGIHWYNLSSFTVGVYQVLDRFSIFDRTPWEGVSDTLKYDSYYQTGQANPGDLRWNYQAFQGVILNGGKLPGDFSFDAFWGKTQPNGGLTNANEDPFSTIINFGAAGNVPTYNGLNGLARVFPNYIAGGKIGKAFSGNQHVVNLNTINSVTALDSLGNERQSYQVHSLSFNSKIDELRIEGELGAGAYNSPTYDQKWGEALMLRLYFPEEYTFLPIDVQVYQVSKKFFNPNGEILTNANPDINNDFPVEIAAGQTSIGGLLTQVNQLAHNRRGINLNTGYNIGPLRLKASWGLAQEIEALSSDITVIHRVNSLAASRIFNPFPANAVSATSFGQYGQFFSFFRGFSERIRTTDVDPATAMPLTRKYFKAVDLQAKMRFPIGSRSLYLFYLGNFSSASSKAGILPSLNEDTYVYAQFHEFDLYYNVLPQFILTGYFGVEQVAGGRFSEWDPVSQRPRDGLGLGYGAGFDWTVAENAGIYVRHRWLRYDERSILDRDLGVFKGNETTIELKIYF